MCSRGQRTKLNSLAVFLGIMTSFINAPPLVSAQEDTVHGTYNELRKGELFGNQVGTVYYNMGEFGDWLSYRTNDFEWPRGSEHTYMAGTAFFVQAKALTKTGSVIYPLETNYYEYTRCDNAGITYGWWPVPGYANRTSPAPATSTDKSTWPFHWPDKTSDWDDSWNGYFGMKIGADQETYFVMDDNQDRHYLEQFRPDTNDNTRGGLGLRVRVRTLQWNSPLAQDIVFLSFLVCNVGTTTYDSMFAGQYVDYSIGGDGNITHNSAYYDFSRQLFVAQSTVPYVQPGNWSPGMVGIGALATPDSNGFTAVATFSIHTYDLNNDQRNWLLISGGTFNLPNTDGVNAAGFLSSGPFSLAPGEQKQMLLTYIFAYDTASLAAKADFARRFYLSGFDSKVLEVSNSQIGLPGTFLLGQNYPNPFNPSTTIQYALPLRSHVTLAVYNTLGQQVATLVSGESEAGSHTVQFDGSKLASGLYFYRLQVRSLNPAKGGADSFTDTKKLLLVR